MRVCVVYENIAVILTRVVVKGIICTLSTSRRPYNCATTRTGRRAERSVRKSQGSQSRSCSKLKHVLHSFSSILYLTARWLDRVHQPSFQL